jgi:NAD(P)-dependent dehydrogenase (short-subunit alcohol dehydrogenase family)
MYWIGRFTKRTIQIKKERIMARVFITGAADGLGLMAAKLLIKEGHKVVLHARNTQRGKDAIVAAPGADGVVIGDLSFISETVEVAQEVNKLGPFDAVIHNAAVGYKEPRRIETPDGLPHVFAVNSLAPYILTCLIHPPQRLVYLSSSLHRSGDTTLKDLTWTKRPWNGYNAYSDSKLHDTILAFAIARKWAGVYSNAVEPGWVATKMGGPGAPDSLEEGPKTQVWLAASNDPKALMTGKYFYHKKLRTPHPATLDEEVQEKFLTECERLSGIKLPQLNS